MKGSVREEGGEGGARGVCGIAGCLEIAELVVCTGLTGLDVDAALLRSGISNMVPRSLTGLD